MKPIYDFHKIILLFLAISTFIFIYPLYSQIDKHQERTNTIGPFTIGNDHLKKVYARVTHIHLSKDEINEWPDSDTSIVILDSDKKVLFKYGFHWTPGEGETTFECKQIYIPKIGYVLEYSDSFAPSDPDDQGLFQFFSTNSKGKFVPITSKINIASYKIVFLDSRNKKKPIQVDSSLSYAAPGIEVEVWSGYYFAKIYYKIFPEGYSKAKHHDLFHFDKIPVSIDTNYIDLWKRGFIDQGITISLFHHPGNDQSQSEEVIIKPNSKVEFLYASFIRDWWLFTSIDGHKGYLSIKDCRTLGFPETSGMPTVLGDDY